WPRGLNAAVQQFEQWMHESAIREMRTLSEKYRHDFIEPIRSVSRQLTQALQDFRNRLSERSERALGVPLRTIEIDFEAPNPASPDVKVGKIFPSELGASLVYVPDVGRRRPREEALSTPHS